MSWLSAASDFSTGYHLPSLALRASIRFEQRMTRPTFIMSPRLPNFNEQLIRKKGKLYTFHFNALRSVMEKTASFFGHPDIAFCLQALNNEEDLALYNRALNLLSHGKYAIHEPVEMGEDNQELFRRILRDFVTAFQFALPEIGENPTSPVSAP
jgi:hypothetical protein